MPFHVPDSVKENLPMPFYDLPVPVEEILRDVDFYLVTHIHPDHIDIAPDGTVGAPLVKEIPIICQNEQDARVFRKSGFHDVKVIQSEGMEIGDIRLSRTPARHGTVVPCGEAMGIMFQSPQENTFYLAGDTVWYPEIQQTLCKYQPKIVALNCCAAETVENGRLIMNDEDVHCVAKTVPDARLYLTHFDNVAHASITRQTMKGRLAKRDVTNYDMLPDGESIEY